MRDTPAAILAFLSHAATVSSTGSLAHDNVTASTSRPVDILRPSINVVHLARPPPPGATAVALRRLVAAVVASPTSPRPPLSAGSALPPSPSSSRRFRAPSVPTRDPQAAVSGLIIQRLAACASEAEGASGDSDEEGDERHPSGSRRDALRFLEEDVCSLVDIFGRDLGGCAAGIWARSWWVYCWDLGEILVGVLLGFGRDLGGCDAGIWARSWWVYCWDLSYRFPSHIQVIRITN